MNGNRHKWKKQKGQYVCIKCECIKTIGTREIPAVYILPNGSKHRKAPECTEIEVKEQTKIIFE